MERRQGVVGAHVRGCARATRGNPLFLRIPISRVFPRDFAPCKRARKDNVPPGTVLRHHRDRENAFRTFSTRWPAGDGGRKREEGGERSYVSNDPSGWHHLDGTKVSVVKEEELRCRRGDGFVI